MGRVRTPFWVPLVLLSALSHAQAQEGVPPAPTKYRLELVYIFEPEATEFIFVVGGVGFKSVATLKKFVSSLPRGSILEWAPGCKRAGGEPLLSSEQELEEFKAFCAEHNIQFTVLPSG